jgi:hypothetical protein
MKKIVLFIITFHLIGGLWSAGQESTNDKSPSDAIDVSLIKLIANGAPYDGKYIRVRGYFRFDTREDHETQALFPSHDDAINITNGIWLRFNPGFDERDIANKWIFVEGVFQNNKHGWMNLYEAEIVNVNRAIRIR